MLGVAPAELGARMLGAEEGNALSKGRRCLGSSLGRRGQAERAGVSAVDSDP